MVDQAIVQPFYIFEDMSAESHYEIYRHEMVVNKMFACAGGLRW